MNIISVAAPIASPQELMVMTVAEIVNQLIQAHEANKDINLNRFCICLIVYAKFWLKLLLGLRIAVYSHSDYIISFIFWNMKHSS